MSRDKYMQKYKLTDVMDSQLYNQNDVQYYQQLSKEQQTEQGQQNYQPQLSTLGYGFANQYNWP